MIEPDEQLEIVANATIFDEPKSTSTVAIKDATGTPANRTIAVTGPLLSQKAAR